MHLDQHMKSHLESIMKDGNAFKCKICLKTFPAEENLNRNNKKECEPEQHECEKCLKIIQVRKML